MMVGGPSRAVGVTDKRPWTFYALGALFAAYMACLYGPMLVIYLLSFQGENGGVTFPMVGTSLTWFTDIVKPGQMANIPVSFSRSIGLALIVSILTVLFSVAAGLAFRRRFPGSGVVFYLAVASLVMPSLLVGFGIGLGFQFLVGRASDLDAAIRDVRDVRRRESLQPLVGGSGRRPRRQRVPAAALRDAADPFARHPWRGHGGVHSVLRRVRPHHADDWPA
jgi:ABC-type Fe3+ transport system permease subunit